MIWNAIKSVKNMVTGNSAEIELFLEEETLELGREFNVMVKATLNEPSLNAKNVYLKIRAIERIEAEGIEIEYEDGEREVETTIVKKSTVTYEEQWLIPINSALNSEQSYEWQFTVSIPEDNNGTYSGQYAWHKYEIQAGLDTVGNDPDTGWQIFEIY
ncbi:MAG: hypothetical protein AAGB12_11395 [Pseudomonadota bacterium]